MISDPVKEESPSTVKKRSPDLAKFWKAVEDDPKDFTGWTYLLQFVDTTGDIDDGREAYDAFLFRYPYCYGYWKKFADLEKRKGNYFRGEYSVRVPAQARRLNFSKSGLFWLSFT